MLSAHNLISYSSALVPLTRQIIQNEGLSALYRGTSVTVLRNVPGVSLYFLCVSRLRPIFSERFDSAKTASFLSGSIARTLCGLALQPLSVVKARAESSVIPRMSLSNHLIDIVKSKGLLNGLFLGAVPTIIRDAPYACVLVIFDLNPLICCKAACFCWSTTDRECYS